MNHDPAIAESVVDGVWRLRSVPGANSYLIELVDGAYVLVDAGTPPAGPVILERLAQLEVAPSALLLSHRHFDHAGGAAELREAFGLRLILGAGDVDGGRVRGDRRPPQLIRRLMGRGRAASSVVDEPVPMTSEVEVLPGVLAIPAPGHTSGSIVFELRDRDLMFVGDLTLNSGDRLSRPLSMANDDTAQQEASLAAIAARATAHGAPGHGEPLTEVFGDWLRHLASMPPAPGGSLLRVLRNPVSAFRFVRRMRG
jgi:glyoxylase-like metal-dependent hydrolase (beta-lactamase superfamily II)